MNHPSRYRARARVRRGINGPAIRVRVFERIEISADFVEGLSSNSFVIHLTSLPAVLRELQSVYEERREVFRAIGGGARRDGGRDE